MTEILIWSPRPEQNVGEDADTIVSNNYNKSLVRLNSELSGGRKVDLVVMPSLWPVGPKNSIVNMNKGYDDIKKISEIYGCGIVFGGEEGEIPRSILRTTISSDFEITDFMIFEIGENKYGISVDGNFVDDLKRKEMINEFKENNVNTLFIPFMTPYEAKDFIENLSKETSREIEGTVIGIDYHKFLGVDQKEYGISSFKAEKGEIISLEEEFSYLTI